MFSAVERSLDATGAPVGCRKCFWDKVFHGILECDNLQDRDFNIVKRFLPYLIDKSENRVGQSCLCCKVVCRIFVTSFDIAFRPRICDHIVVLTKHDCRFLILLCLRQGFRVKRSCLFSLALRYWLTLLLHTPSFHIQTFYFTAH